MELKPGYKQTEVGVIPEDWEVVQLRELIRFVEYGSSAKSRPSGLVPVLRMGNLQDGKIDWDDLVFTDDKNEIEKYKLLPGDVLFNRTNTIDLVGKTAIYNGEIPAIFAGYLIRVNVDKELLNSQYLNYILNTEFAKKYSQKVLSVAVGQANINGQKLKTYPIPLPPTKAEQTAIADALSDADALIAALERLTEKKRQIKQGAMQTLLNPHDENGRLKAGWVVKRLGEIGSTYGGLTGKSKADFGKGSARYIPFVNVMNNVVIDSGFLEKVVISKNEAQNEVRVGDLLFNGSSETPEELGLCSVLQEDIEALYLNSFCFGFRLFNQKEVNALFLAYFFRSKYGREVLYSLAQGATRYNLSKTNFIKLLLLLPNSDEQTRITAILSDMDAELDALETKLAKAKAIKQGMMQNLLTGRIRLI